MTVDVIGDFPHLHNHGAARPVEDLSGSVNTTLSHSFFFKFNAY